MQNADLKTLEKITSIVKESCNIDRMRKFGEISLESVIYLLTCKNDDVKLIAKVATGDTDYSSEISIMRDPYMQDNRLCPKLYQYTNDVIIMEFIPFTLARWLAVLALNVSDKNSVKRPFADETNRVLQSLVDKLFKFHNKYSHGDLHSNNILVNPKTYECFIIDFTNNRRMADARQFELDNLKRSFYIYTLDYCAEMLKSRDSEQYKTCEKIVNFFDNKYKDTILKIYNIKL